MHLVKYVCEDIYKNGDCNPEEYHVVVVTRNLSVGLSDEKQELINKALRSACFEPGDLVPTTHSGNS